LDNCRRYGVIVERKKCCGGLFADDIVLIAPGKKSLRKSLNKVHEWAIKNEMTFDINKCATLVVKPLHFKNQDDYVEVLTQLLKQLNIPILAFHSMNHYPYSL